MRWILYEAVAPSGKRYVGVTSRLLKQRVHTHRYAAKRGSMLPFHKALRKHGDAVRFRALVVGEREYILDLEAKTIEAFRTRDKLCGYNVALGGDASPMLTPEVAANCSKAKRGKPNPLIAEANHKRIITDQMRAKVSAAFKGKKRPQFSAEWRANISAARLGIKMPPRTAEARANLSAALKGKAKSPAHRAALSIAARNRVKSPASQLGEH